MFRRTGTVPDRHSERGMTMAMSEARRKRLAANVIRSSGTKVFAPSAESEVKPAPKKEPKSELAKVRAAYRATWDALTDAERVVLARWIEMGPPATGRIETSDKSTEIPVLSTTNVVAGDVQEHLPDWGKSKTIVRTIEFECVNYDEFDPTRRVIVQAAWDTRSLLLALTLDGELYKQFWRNRGGCREGDMGPIRDEIAAIRQVRVKERTADVAAYLAQLERRLVTLEHEHEAPLRAARDLAVRQGFPARQAYDALTEGMCPHCRGTSILHPDEGAPPSLVREWEERATARADHRFIVLEATRRTGLNHDLDLGHESWAAYRWRILEAVSVPTGAKDLRSKVRNDASGSGQRWQAQHAYLKS